MLLHPSRSARIAGPIVALLLALAGCSSSSGGGSSDDGGNGNGNGNGATFDRNALLASVGTNGILPTLRAFVTAADGLAAATVAHRSAVDSAGGRSAAGAATLPIAQQAWRDAMAAWQRAEVMQVGPAAPSSFPGGQGLRDEIYSWPTTNPCRIDQEIVENDFERADFFATELVNTYGLDALEYLLFETGPDNACDPPVDINADGTWDLIKPDVLAQRRAAYAEVAARGVAARAAELRDAWEPDGGDFLGELATAGQGSATYSTARAALDDVFAALFYLELQTKDEKLAEPAGILPRLRGDHLPRRARVALRHLLEGRT